LHQRIIAGVIFQRAGTPIGAKVAIDQRRLRGAQRLRAEPELVDRARPHVLDHHIGVFQNERLQRAAVTASRRSSASPRLL